METVGTCPLGHTCEEARDEKIYRCRWFVRMGVVDDRTGQLDPKSEYDECTIPLQGVHLSELKKRTLGVQKAVEETRNVVAKNPPIQIFGALKGNGKDQLELAGAARTQRLISGGEDISGDSDVDGGAGKEL